jgi:hypothetical protein
MLYIYSLAKFTIANNLLKLAKFFIYPQTENHLFGKR